MLQAWIFLNFDLRNLSLTLGFFCHCQFLNSIKATEVIADDGSSSGDVGDIGDGGGENSLLSSMC